MERQKRWFVGLILAAVLGGPLQPHASAALYAGLRFKSEPKMNFIPNTDVYYQRNAPGYDLYRYADQWYLVEQGVWYRADTWRGPFISVEFSTLPEEVVSLSQPYQRYWVVETDYRDRVRDVPDGSWASDRTLDRKPKMNKITRTGITYATGNPDFDIYRYRSTWYLVDKGVWYKCETWKGPFVSIRAKKVPRDVLNVPTAYRRHWAVSAVYRPDRESGRNWSSYWSSGATIDVEPRMFLVPDTRVYTIRDETDYDLYRYGDRWYLMDSGNWYRANTWRGPFITIGVGTVPREVLAVPAEHRRDGSDSGD